MSQLDDLIREREPDLDKLRAERDRMPTDEEFFSTLGVLLEGGVRGLVREWKGELR